MKVLNLLQMQVWVFSSLTDFKLTNIDAAPQVWKKSDSFFLRVGECLVDPCLMLQS